MMDTLEEKKKGHLGHNAAVSRMETKMYESHLAILNILQLI